MSAAETQDILDELMKILQDRRDNPSAGSYTASLFAGGESKIGAKILEEAAELVESTSDQESYSRQHFIHETADLFFHHSGNAGKSGGLVDRNPYRIKPTIRRFRLTGKANRRSSNPKPTRVSIMIVRLLGAIIPLVFCHLVIPTTSAQDPAEKWEKAHR